MNVPGLRRVRWGVNSPTAPPSHPLSHSATHSLLTRLQWEPRGPSYPWVNDRVVAANAGEDTLIDAIKAQHAAKSTGEANEHRLGIGFDGHVAPAAAAEGAGRGDSLDRRPVAWRTTSTRHR